MTQLGKVATLIGLTVAAIGLVLGFVPTSVTYPNSNVHVSCGGGFFNSDFSRSDDGLCDAALSTQRGLALGVLATSVVITGGAVLLFRQKRLATSAGNAGS